MLSCAGLFIVVLTSAIQKQDQLTCRNLKVKIDYDSGIAFLTENEIKDRINFLNGENIIGKSLDRIDFRSMEKDVEHNPFVDRAEVFVDGQQNITVEVFQKRPVLRILNNDGVSYYLGEKNEHIPLSDKFTSHVAIAVGNVQMHNSTKRDSTVQADLYHMMLYIRKDGFLNSLVDQLDVKETGEVDVIPKIKGHVIHFGSPSGNIEGKFDRLKIFYREGLEKVGWMKYSAIDLRYMNQVVCEKRDTVESIK